MDKQAYLEEIYNESLNDEIASSRELLDSKIPASFVILSRFWIRSETLMILNCPSLFLYRDTAPIKIPSPELFIHSTSLKSITTFNFLSSIYWTYQKSCMFYCKDHNQSITLISLVLIFYRRIVFYYSLVLRFCLWICRAAKPPRDSKDS